MRLLVIAACQVAFCAAPLLAAIEPLSPVGGEVVPLLPDLQKKVLAMPALTERIAYFAANKGDKSVQCGTTYRTSRPLVFRFRDAVKTAYPSRPCRLVRSDAATDARYFTQFGKPLPMLGMECAGGHSDSEWVDLDDIPRFTAMLVGFLGGR